MKLKSLAGKYPVKFNIARPVTTLPPGSRLGTPGAMLFIVGLALVYFALHGWDKKYGTFHGTFAGKDAKKTG